MKISICLYYIFVWKSWIRIFAFCFLTDACRIFWTLRAQNALGVIYYITLNEYNLLLYTCLLYLEAPHSYIFLSTKIFFFINCVLWKMLTCITRFLFLLYIPSFREEWKAVDFWYRVEISNRSFYILLIYLKECFTPSTNMMIMKAVFDIGRSCK